jgi:hypothetical protein
MRRMKRKEDMKTLITDLNNVSISGGNRGKIALRENFSIFEDFFLRRSDFLDK